MKTQRIINLVILITITISCLSVGNVPQIEVNKLSNEISQYVDALQSKDEQERKNADKSILKNHELLIDDLIKLVTVKLEPEPSVEVQKKVSNKYYAKELAIALLGELRSVKAVPVLMENLDYENPFILLPPSYMDIGSRYRAAEALSKIGMPAVEPLIDKLREYEKYKLDTGISCWILQKILGVKLANACIQIAIDETKDENVKKKLGEAASWIVTNYGNAR